MLSFFRRSFPEIDYVNLIEKLQQNDQTEIKNLLFRSDKIEYLPITFTMLAKMAKSTDLTENLSLYKKHTKGKYELAIFEVPWNESDDKFLPLIFDKKENKIVGIMLPFNELLSEISYTEGKQISKLSMIWTGFIMQNRFGKKLDNT